MCGIFGISCNDYSYSVAGLIYPGLMAIQHRGQKFAGIATTNSDGRISSYKDKGLVPKVLNPDKLKTFSGNVGIGHVCSGDSKTSHVYHAQPYHLKTEQAEFALSFNGSISNYKALREQLIRMGKVFTTKTDIELIATLIETFLKFSDDMLETLKTIMNMLKGSFCLVLLEPDGTLYAMRDSTGYKPLSYGNLELHDKFFHIIASESTAFDALGGNYEDDIKPGEIVIISIINGLSKVQTSENNQLKICQFEYTYFARPDSVLEGRNVGEVRFNLGRNLAKLENFPTENAIVVPIPDTGRLAAMGYAFESGILYQEGLMKNRYLWQSIVKIEDKLNPLKTIVKGKDIILIDDTIVSGNTMQKIIRMLRKSNAKSIHVRVASPPIINYCSINSSFPNRSKLIAYQEKLKHYDNFNDELRKIIDADSLRFQTLEGLIKAIGIQEENICLGCIIEYCLANEREKQLHLELII
ncbi:MAG: amidophosphoribosyltransferase [Promethearchaeota archaeon]